MAAWGRNYNKSQDWDPMREDFNNKTYDAQYPDDDASDGVQLDHCRLYITNIPNGLNDEGLRSVFSNYGNLVEVYLSRDPTKRYALVSFETPSEAKLAMMKMNRTEPLKLFLSIAHKHKKSDRQRSNVNSGRERKSNKEDTASISSKGKYSRKAESTNGDGETVNGFPIQEDMSVTDPLDASLNLELENLKLEQLKIREEQLMCKHRMLLLKQAERKPALQSSGNTRCILPDGRIVVRNASERGMDTRDADATYAAGAGDSPSMPALQRDACRQCVCCGALADSYCARCGVTPYCSARCQRRDWVDRHKTVCHNLARLSTGASNVNDGPELVSIAHAPPLRRPHPSAFERDAPRNDDAGDRACKKYRQPDPSSVFKLAQLHGNSVDFHRKPIGKQNIKLRDANPGNSKNNQQQKNIPRNEAKPKSKEVAPVKQNASKPLVESVKREDKKSDVIEEKVAVKDDPKQMEPKVSATVKETDMKTTLVPRTYLIEHLSVGDSVLLSVDGKAADCRTSSPGFVCLSMHEKFEADFQKLCEDYVLDCEDDTTEFLSFGAEAPRPIRKWLESLKEDLKVNGPPALQVLLAGPERLSPGMSLSYRNPEDSGWYRARCLNPTTIALLDSGKVVTLVSSDKCKKLPAKYQEIPEFCCVLDAKVKIGDNLRCTLVSKTAGGYKVSVHDVDSGSELGDGEVARWTPDVEHPVQPVAPAVPAAAKVPEVPRPPLVQGARVVFTDAARAAGGVRVCVRAAAAPEQRRFDAVLQDVVLYGTTASPLKEPPLQGQTVVAKFTDGLHYRALCRRTNVKQNKYQIEYIEYGNIQVSKLERLYPCPAQFEMHAASPVTSIVTLQLDAELTRAAEEYLHGLNEEEMILTLTSALTAPSGSVANLTTVKDNENVHQRLVDLCTPEWKRIQQSGGDVVDTPSLMYGDLECLQLPAAGCELQVLDVSLLEDGSVSACQLGLPHADYVFTNLASMMAEYCDSELGREPYLPKVEELCIAKCPNSQQWFRAVFLEQLDGPGGDKARVLYVDTGYLGVVPVNSLRKMLSEFVVGLPAVACHLEIKEFPARPTAAMLSRARRHMRVDARGRGRLRVSGCCKLDDGMYSVQAQDLLRAMLDATD